MSRSSLRNILIALTILLLVSSPRQTSAQETAGGWTQVGNGFEYQEFFVANPGPNHVYVVRMDRNNPSAIIESSMPLGKLSGAFETVSGMSRRYDEALNFWGEATIPHSTGGWGARNHVVAAINGEYFQGENSNFPPQGQGH